MNMKKLTLILIGFLLLEGCRKDEIPYPITLNDSIPIKVIESKTNTIPRKAESDGLTLEVNAILDSSQFYPTIQAKSPIVGNPDWSRFFMEDKPVDNEYDVNDIVLDFYYRTLNRSVSGPNLGIGNTVPLKTKINATCQAVGSAGPSPGINLGILIKTFPNNQTILRPDTLIDNIKMNGSLVNFTTQDGIVKILGFPQGYRTGFWNTPKWLNPGVSFLNRPNLNNIILKPYAGNINWVQNSYSKPNNTDSINIEITYKRTSIDNLYKKGNLVVIYHLDPFPSSPNFKYMRKNTPYSFVNYTNTAWSIEFIDLRYTYPKLFPSYIDFSSRIDSLAYMK